MSRVSRQILTRIVLTLRDGGSDVPARLGLEAGALAWPRAALAFKILRPSWGLAWPRNGF